MSAWKVRLSTFDLSPDEKRAAHRLFQYLLDHFDYASNFSEYEKRFLQSISEFQSVLSLERIVVVIGLFEEIILSLLMEQERRADIRTGYRWLHTLALSLLCCVTREHPKNSRQQEKGDHVISYSTERIEPTIRRWKSISRLDEVLLTAHSLEEALSRSVRFIAEETGFRRGALFWYSFLSRTVEGVYAHQLDIGEIRRVRDVEGNIPVIARVMKEGKPLYLRESRLYIPLHYVERFGLTSLQVATLYGPHRQPVGFLLLDQGGRPFEPDPETEHLLSDLVSRLSLTLKSHLFVFENASYSVEVGSPLTQREREILQLIADGHSTREIGQALHISEHTTAEHAHSVLRKLKARNRPQAVAFGLRKGWIR
jgi:DNA-binding CsgD family transcriptional regulator